MSANEKKVAAVVSDSNNALEDSSITMVDVLEQEEMLEDEYNAVLGASDEKCCTYVKGAIKRQALYSCLTCCPDAREDLTKAAGICLACSYRCHNNHELIELYTKRNFRCDCPTTRMGSNRCELNPQLSAQQPPPPPNKDNLYNHNFQGLYCKCKRPYPDPQRTTQELMLQCAICEDWYHLAHLNAPEMASSLLEACSEIVCDTCMERHAFLRDYTGLALKPIEQNLNETDLDITVTGDTSICEENDTKLKSELDKSISDIMNINESDAVDDVAAASAAADEDAKIKEQQDEIEEPAAKRQKPLPADEKEEEEKPKAESQQTLETAQNTECKRPRLDANNETNDIGVTFWRGEWRSALCQCSVCLAMYKEQHIEFLIDTEDSPAVYEERGQERAAKSSKSYELGIRALATMGHVQQIEAITEYNRMKDKLKEYLQSFAAEKKVVTEEDITRFFERMRNENNANLGQPFFCR